MNTLIYWSDDDVNRVADRLRARGRLLPITADTVRLILHEAEAVPVALASRETPAFPCVSCGAGCSGRYDAEGHREGYCLKCGETQPPLSPRDSLAPKETK